MSFTVYKKYSFKGKGNPSVFTVGRIELIELIGVGLGWIRRINKFFEFNLYISG